MLTSCVEPTDQESRLQVCHTDTHYTTVTAKRKGRRKHLSRVDKTQRAPNASPIHASSEIGPGATRIYHCTACPKSFKNAYSWKRHELAVHGYDDTEWVCMRLGSVTSEGDCVFCHNSEKNMTHTDMHKIHDCLGKDVHDRTFACKNLLKQHIQQKHLAGTEDLVSKAFQVPEVWKKDVDAINIKSEALWCGFCTYICESVANRVEHVSEHFRDGYDMDGWVHLTI